MQHRGGRARLSVRASCPGQNPDRNSARIPRPRTREEAVMFRTQTLVLAGLALAWVASPVRAEGAPLAETREKRDSRMAWWRQARFGMFIHWGLYAVPAGAYDGQRDKDIGEWIMKHLRIPIPEYERFAAQFNPTRFDAREWVRIAQDA